MSQKAKNIVTEVVTVLGIAQGVLPQLTAVSHVPAWVGIALAGAIQILNAILKDNPPATP